MNIKQIPIVTTVMVLLAVSSIGLALATAPVAEAAANSKEITCADGKTVTAKKGMKPNKNKLDSKDYDHACRSHGGYSACGGVETAIITCDADNSGATKDNGLWQLLIIVINIMTAGVGIVAVGGIVYGAILYTTAEDKADQVKSAVDIIVNVVIGLILFALMWAGLNFIVPGGVFN